MLGFHRIGKTAVGAALTLTITMTLGCATRTQDGPAAESPTRPQRRAAPATASATTDLRKPTGGVRGVMYQKLQHTNGILRGITTEDFPSIKKHAAELVHLTHEGQWKTINAPDYQRHSEEFLRAVQSLGADGESGDIDGATLHYFQMTLACVNCHRYIRRIYQ